MLDSPQEHQDQRAPITAGDLPALPQKVTEDLEILDFIGGGRSGGVWLARNPCTGQTVALKCVWRSRFDDDRQYRLEMQGVRRIFAKGAAADAVIPVHHFLETPTAYAYTMAVADPLPSSDPAEGYRAHSLAAEIRESAPLTPERCLEILEPLSQAVATLEENGLCHADVKPDNVVFRRRLATLADIGLVSQSSSPISAGTRGFVPAEGSPQSRDVFALGKMLYEMLTGVGVEQFPAIPSSTYTALQGDRAGRKVWRSLFALVERACDAGHEEPFPSGAAFHAEVRRLRQDHRHPWLRPAAAAVAALVGVVALPLAASLRSASQGEPAPMALTPSVSTQAQPTPLTLDAAGELLGSYRETLEKRRNSLGMLFEPWGDQVVTKHPMPAPALEELLQFSGQSIPFERISADELGPLGAGASDSFAAALVPTALQDEVGRLLGAFDRRNDFLHKHEFYVPVVHWDSQDDEEELAPVFLRLRRKQIQPIQVLTRVGPAQVFEQGRLISDTGKAFDYLEGTRLEVRKPGYRHCSLVPSPRLPSGIWPVSVEMSPWDGFEQLGPELKNPIGMRFREVEGILVSVFETRVCEMDLYCQETGMKPFHRNPGFGISGDALDHHPAVYVSMQDALSFCDWLTQRDLDLGHLPENFEYRLPTDREWSRAAGLANDVGTSIEARDADARVEATYPWGQSWPPAPGSGNFRDQSASGATNPRITGYEDGFELTSPVGHFSANGRGFHDMQGNAAEWVLDDYNGMTACRGGSWGHADENVFRSKRRTAVSRDRRYRDNLYGFRVVLAPRPISEGTLAVEK